MESWQLSIEGLHPGDSLREESLFTLADGMLGWRGNYEEGCTPDYPQSRGCYLNGFFEKEKIRYGEIAYGYAENSQTMLNVTDSQAIGLCCNGEPLRFGEEAVLSSHRSLKLHKGLLHRITVYRMPGGGTLQLDSTRLVSLVRPGVAAIRWRIHASTDCTLTLLPQLDGNVSNRAVQDDPRVGSGLQGRVLSQPELQWQDDKLCLTQHTQNSALALACAMACRVAPECTPQRRDSGMLVYELHLKAGQDAELCKFCAYAWGNRQDTPRHATLALAQAQAASQAGFDRLLDEQEEAMRAFWSSVGLEITGDDGLLFGMRFNLFHLMQSAGRDGRTNICAKGLTGEGYEGHYFWDTETYMLPFFDSTQPRIARKLLEYRYAILPLARERAREMGHSMGALYPWRTIDGHEASAYYPAGTAQYHINADIAMAIRRYVRCTGDVAFLDQMGAEMLCEISRLYLDLGFYDPAHGGAFCINGVTGPDEYNALVNNNTYTNLMAAESMLYAAEVLHDMAGRDPDAYGRLAQKIGLSSDEPDRWRQAAESIYVPREENTPLIWQDDAFQSRVPWPLSTIPKENFPLLLHYHPLVIYRHMVCKQADLVLAMLLLPHRFTEEEKKAAFDFYDRVTTHDSSLSHAAFSALASRIGSLKKAYAYFRDSAILDVEDTHGNTADGLHMANMAGSWFCLVYGFGGLDTEGDMLRFHPILPPPLKSYAFRLNWKGSVVEMRVDGNGPACRLVSGPDITILAGDRLLSLSTARTV